MAIIKEIDILGEKTFSESKQDFQNVLVFNINAQIYCLHIYITRRTGCSILYHEIDSDRFCELLVPM